VKFALLLCLIAGACLASEGRWQLCEVTAYAPHCAICQTTGVTADGTCTDDRPYGVAASRDIGLGSQVWIPADSGYMAEHFSDRWFAVDDRGSGLDAERSDRGIPRIDVRYRTHDSAKRFGRKTVLIYIRSAK
jgi:3D (Asp-Asp-Asp) domain-containing protein